MIKNMIFFAVLLIQHGNNDNEIICTQLNTRIYGVCIILYDQGVRAISITVKTYQYNQIFYLIYNSPSLSNRCDCK